VVFPALVDSILKLAHLKKGWSEFMIKSDRICNTCNEQIPWGKASYSGKEPGTFLCEECLKSEPIETTLEEDCSKIFRSCVELISKKNNDYSGGGKFEGFLLSSNISGVDVVPSLMVRLGDKIGRLKSLLGDNYQLVKEESIEDTIKDAINYLAILHAFRMGCLDSKESGRKSK
jgi:hypothetical protein